ncbi:MAG: hypothetical protein V3T05_10050, partial [Myxococcota bacterium]
LDDKFAIDLPPGSFTEDVTVRVTQHTISPAKAVTLTKVYAIALIPETTTPAYPLNADVVFELSSDKLPVGGVSALRVAHGDDIGDPWFEVLTGSYDSVFEQYKTTTSSLSYFMVVDYDGYGTCSCDTGSGCQAGCDFCDPECNSNTSCTSNEDCGSGQACLDGVCFDYCTSDTQCGSGLCCVDGICMGGSSCNDCSCDWSSTCDEGCSCDPDCNTSCSCDTSSGYCDSFGDCSCDPDCSTCWCNYGPGCDSGCACDTECSSGCSCDTTTSCEADCSCDLDCQGGGGTGTGAMCSGTSSPPQTQCPGGACYSGRCYDYCFSDQTCLTGYTCSSGFCIELCSTDTECGTGGCCFSGWCAYDDSCGSTSCTCNVTGNCDSSCTCDPDCSIGGCQAGDWQCANGDCIPAGWRCDRYSSGPDCTDGSDEDPYCPTCSSNAACPSSGAWICDTTTGTCYQGGSE